MIALQECNFVAFEPVLHIRESPLDAGQMPLSLLFGNTFDFKPNIGKH
jgi:hypothetical protein